MGIAPKWGLQYVGKMGQPLHMKVNGHWYDIKSPVVEHFNSRKHKESNMAVMAIEFPQNCGACHSFECLGMDLSVDGQ